MDGGGLWRKMPVITAEKFKDRKVDKSSPFHRVSYTFLKRFYESLYDAEIMIL